ncbi:MAG: hypothetical protein ACRC6X_00025 [Culicoidibacterales bacterium]
MLKLKLFLSNDLAEITKHIKYGGKAVLTTSEMVYDYFSLVSEELYFHIYLIDKSGVKPEGTRIVEKVAHLKMNLRESNLDEQQDVLVKCSDYLQTHYFVVSDTFSLNDLLDIVGLDIRVAMTPEKIKILELQSEKEKLESRNKKIMQIHKEIKKKLLKTERRVEQRIAQVERYKNRKVIRIVDGIKRTYQKIKKRGGA